MPPAHHLVVIRVWQAAKAIEKLAVANKGPGEVAMPAAAAKVAGRRASVAPKKGGNAPTAVRAEADKSRRVEAKNAQRRVRCHGPKPWMLPGCVVATEDPLKTQWGPEPWLLPGCNGSHCDVHPWLAVFDHVFDLAHKDRDPGCHLVAYMYSSLDGRDWM